MPPLFDSHPPVRHQLGLAGFCIQRIQRLGVDCVHVRSHRKATQQYVPFRPDSTGKLPQDPFDFFFFFCYITFDIVIQVHHGHGLNKQRSPGAALVVYNAGEVGPVFLFNGNHIPVPPHGDQRILKILLVVGVMEYFFQLGPYLAFRTRNPDAQSRQLHGSRVQDLPFFRNAFFQLTHQLGKLRQVSSVFGQIRMVVAFCQQENLQRTKGLQAGFNIHQFFHIQHAADAGPLHGFGNVVQTPKRKPFSCIQQTQDLRRLHVHALHGLKFCRDAQGQQLFFAQLRGRFLRNPLFHFVKLQRFDGKTP